MTAATALVGRLPASYFDLKNPDRPTGG